MSVSQILTNAKALISDPANWTIGTFARDENNNPVKILSKEATKFCSMGAVYKISFQKEEQKEAIKMLREEALKINYSGIAELNDELGHEEVMNLFDLAIAKAKEQEM